MREYASTIILLAEDAEDVRKLNTGGDFSFDFRDDPTLSHWEKNSGPSIMCASRIPDKEEIELYRSLGHMPAKELIIRCNDENTAETVRELIYCGTVLEYPSLFEYREPPYCYELTNPSYYPVSDPYFRQEINDLVLFGCVIACKAWKCDELTYSLEKFRLSLRLDSFTPHSGHPSYGQMFEYDQNDHRSHVEAAHAALVAYSVVEELGVDIRSSPQKPRFMKNGEWNPLVKADVIARLGKVGVREDEEMLWSLRGIPTPMGQEIRPILGKESEFCVYEDVRDRTLKVYEAIHYASYIRNFFLAHKFSELTKFITPYDVNNLQSLARLLLLSALGLWRKSKEELIGEFDRG